MLSLKYEYRVIPAPRRGAKSKSAGSAQDRFALALSQKMNEMGRDGWEYVRTDTLPMDERAGLTGTKTSYMNMLVFRRVILHSARLIEPANEDFDITTAIFDPPKKLASFAKSALQALSPTQTSSQPSNKTPNNPPSKGQPKGALSNAALPDAAQSDAPLPDAAQTPPSAEHLAAQ
ncbi:MAG: DUF4177 domain-containing protein [Cypionkella sp.]